MAVHLTIGLKAVEVRVEGYGSRLDGDVQLIGAGATVHQNSGKRPRKDGRGQKLVGQKAAPKASGTATLICNKPNTKRAFTIEARGLDTRKVYTMWLIRTVKKGGKSKKEMLGLGKAPHVLKVDKKGKAKFVYNPKDCPDITRWQQLKIVEHKDKNAKNMKKIAPVLVGDLTKLKS